MKQKKKLLIVISSIVVLFALIAAGILAFAARASDSVDNQFSIVNQKGDIKETGFTPDEDITIGEEVDKEVMIENNGETDFFVRVMVFPEIKTSDGDSSTLLPATIGEEIEIVIGTDWEDGEDGYFYYKGKVVPGDATSHLFTEVGLASGLGATYEGATLDMQIKSETVTASNLQYRKVWWNYSADTAPTETKWKIVDDALSALVGP